MMWTMPTPLSLVERCFSPQSCSWDRKRCCISTSVFCLAWLIVILLIAILELVASRKPPPVLLHAIFFLVLLVVQWRFKSAAFARILLPIYFYASAVFAWFKGGGGRTGGQLYLLMSCIPPLSACLTVEKNLTSWVLCCCIITVVLNSSLCAIELTIDPFSGHPFEESWPSVEAYVVEPALVFTLQGLAVAGSMAVLIRSFQAEMQRRCFAESAQSRFLAMMSHEIRTPLNGVLGPLQLLKEEDITEAQRDLVSAMLISGRTLLAVVNDVLHFSKLSANMVTFELIPIDVCRVVTQCMRSCEVAADSKQLTLEFLSGRWESLWITSDPSRISQVMYNLLGNAIKFTNVGGVTVRLDLLDDHNAPITSINTPTRTQPTNTLLIEIIDTGCGIDSDDLSKLFLPFTQANHSISRTHGGTGLGLSIVKHIVSLMGGTIAVRSVMGEGTTFTVRLPVHLFDSEEPSMRSSPSFEQQLPTAHTLESLDSALINARNDEEVPADLPLAQLDVASDTCVLVVDDIAMNLVVMNFILRRLPVGIRFATSGQAALDILAATGEGDFPTVVLMDFHMPHMSGMEATRRIRAQGLRVPIIGVTADVVDGPTHEEALAAGMQAVLPKPVNATALRNCIETHCSPTATLSSEEVPLVVNSRIHALAYGVCQPQQRDSVDTVCGLLDRSMDISE
eukprot:NODE_154_length_2165_cov_287.521739_g126_i0.p1 GENE.NODE_154_length_2165_cov_287.521739_g126_i0~~NODE_154_length_2165_cov_287.521739_g126_i0.p1  ORF type:complete len:680 (+),score=122.62 NODE_154_length_2165_cov_287.521739_g126_i0:56-2095(+)